MPVESHTSAVGESTRLRRFVAARASEREYDALTKSACWRSADDRMVVRVVGSDRVSFLHGMCSNDVKGLRAGGILYALFLTEHAHVIADFRAWALDDVILIEIERSLWPPAKAHLEKLLVADDVEFEEFAHEKILEVVGPEAMASTPGVNRIGVIEPWHFAGAGDVLIGKFPIYGTAAIAIVGAKGKVDDLVTAMKGVTEVGAPAIDVLRIENGVAKVGVDTTEKTIALEARLEPAISFSKGCYVGQETIERATARGGLKKKLYGLRFEGAEPPEIGAAISLDGKEVGHLTSAAVSPRFGAIGLAILHHSVWTDGATVEARGSAHSVRAVVSDLPFK